MKILVVDDHALVREGLSQVLKGLDAELVVLQATQGACALALAAEHPDLDLVLLDYHLPDMSGMEVLHVLARKQPELPVVMLSGTADLQTMRQVMAQGAAGFVTKASQSQDLLSVLRRVLEGEVYVPPELRLEHELRRTPGAGAQKAVSLTPRQEDVLYLLLAGQSNKEISRSLGLGTETTKNHVSAIFRAFGVNTRIQAVMVAGQHGYRRTVASA